jgi:glucokinase
VLVRFGVDVGGTTTKIGMFDKQCELIKKCQIKTNKTDKGINILSDVCFKINELLDEYGLTKNECLGVGIGLPGPVTEDGSILGCVNLGWGVFNVRETLSRMLEYVPVTVFNDANMAALGEQQHGGGRGSENVVMVTLGTGVGGGIISGEKIVTGANGAAGEIGHICVNPDETEKCNCGKRGCLEQYASASGVVRMAKKYMNEGRKSQYLLAAMQSENDSSIGEFSAKDVFDGEKMGDDLCKMAVEDLGRYLGLALSTVASVTNPDCIVIGGGVSNAGQPLIDVVKKYFKEYAFLPCSNVIFKLAELGNDAGIYGGASNV